MSNLMDKDLLLSRYAIKCMCCNYSIFLRRRIVPRFCTFSGLVHHLRGFFVPPPWYLPSESVKGKWANVFIIFKCSLTYILRSFLNLTVSNLPTFFFSSNDQDKLESIRQLEAQLPRWWFCLQNSIQCTRWRLIPQILCIDRRWNQLAPVPYRCQYSSLQCWSLGGCWCRCSGTQHRQ